MATVGGVTRKQDTNAEATATNDHANEKSKNNPSTPSDRKGTDVEKNSPIIPEWNQHPMGYPRLAEYMALNPSNAIFTRFDALNARILLYMQAELTYLQEKLYLVEKSDNTHKNKRKREYAIDYCYIMRSDLDGDTTQLRLIEKIKEKLEKYNELLLQRYKLHHLDPPFKFDLKNTRNFIYSEDMGAGEGIMGTDAHIYGRWDDLSAAAQDLVGPSPRKSHDLFSRFFAKIAVYSLELGFGRFVKADKRTGYRGFYEEQTLKVTHWVTSIIASLLPIASILVLMSVDTMKKKLFIVGGFNVLFSVILTLATDAKRSEIFALTAAFAAVQVVFVGTGSESYVGCEGTQGVVATPNS